MDREQVKQILREHGLKATTQRLLVLEAIASCPGRHLTAEEIFELVKADYPEIGLATIYRTIQLFAELHLVDRINFDDGFMRYEIGNPYNSMEKHRHHHLICKKCGRVIPFQDDLLEELEEKIAVATGFLVVDHDVKLYGCCIECGGKLIEEEKRE